MFKLYFKTTDICKVVLLIACVIISACDSILAEDISDAEVTVLAPLSNSSFQEGSVSFKWESIENAEQYRIQIVEPSFENTSSFVIDSIVTNSEVSFSLTPDTYAWRVRAENNAFETNYTEAISFVVEGNDDLSSQTVVLTTPANDFYTNNLQFNFVWESLADASSYVFQLIKGDENSTDVVEQESITNNFYLSTATLEESQYTWKVSGLNSLSNTETASRQFFMDLTAPNTATSLSPVDGNTGTSLTIDFSWTLGTDPGTVNAPVTSTIEIASDDQFTSIIHSEDITEEQVSYTFSSIGTYYWRVQASDEAGNVGDYSAVNELIIE